MNGEVETGKAFRQTGHNPAGSVFALTAEDKIIGNTSQKTATRHPGGTSLSNQSSRP
jgi:hypothetical protein